MTRRIVSGFRCWYWGRYKHTYKSICIRTHHQRIPPSEMPVQVRVGAETKTQSSGLHGTFFTLTPPTPPHLLLMLIIGGVEGEGKEKETDRQMRLPFLGYKRGLQVWDYVFWRS